MKIKSIIAKPFAKQVSARNYKKHRTPYKTQENVLKKLVKGAKNTTFGIDHNFNSITNYATFKNQVPIRDYEGLKKYIEQSVDGKANVLWKGKPLYFAKTSGTTSGAKYIPLTKESMPSHIKAARNALLHYISETNDTSFLDGKMIFLQGSPILDKTDSGIALGRLSGIVAHYVPSYLSSNKMPSHETNCIEDWETKVDAIVEETIKENMTVISGIPSWVQMYFEKIIEKTGKPVGEVFPNFNLFVYGGVNFAPYKATFESLIGRKVNSIELYPASEGFIAFQDSQKSEDEGMLLLIDNGIFYEFIEADTFNEDAQKRVSLEEVKIGVNYVIILNTNAGLWGYNIGDTVKFTSLDPHRIIVTGRIKHFISAFGEHVIGKEVEEAIKYALSNCEATIQEFTVAPQINPINEELPYHEWCIEFDKEPDDITKFTLDIENSMLRQNSYYEDLITGKVLQPLKVTKIPKDGFKKYMKSIGKLGGQNKIPRLSNDRKIVDQLLK